MEERLVSINSMTDIGRVPSHISGNYGVFSAAEWKNWTITYSLFCLCGILPKITTGVGKSLFWHVVFYANRFYPLTIYS